MNAVFGRFFDVAEAEAADPSASKELTGEPYFIFDVQLHYVGAAYDPANAEAERKGAVSKGGLMGLRKRAQQMNPKLASDSGTLADLSWQNFIKEVFLDSETAIGLISTPPGPYPQEAVVPPKEMTHIRDEINRITQSRRMLAHGLVTPQLGQTDLDFMELQAETLKVDAWKAYTGSCPKGFDTGLVRRRREDRLPDARESAQLGVRRFCVHKGLPLGPVADYNHPRDLIKAAKDFPGHRLFRVPLGTARRDGAESHGRGAMDHRVLRDEEEGTGHQEHLHGAGIHLRATRHDQPHGLRPSAWPDDRRVRRGPCAMGHGLDLVRHAAVADRSVPAFPDSRSARSKSTGTRRSPAQVKEQIFGLNAARVFGVDVNAKRNEIPGGLSEPDQDGVSGGRRRPESSLVWLGCLTRGGRSRLKRRPSQGFGSSDA